MTGWLAETYSFQAGLIFAGAMDGLAGLTVLPLIFLKAREKRLKAATQPRESEGISNDISSKSQVGLTDGFKLCITAA